MDYVHEIDSLIQEVSLAIGKPISRDTYEIVDRGLPHIPPTRLPAGKMAIYMFLLGDEFLKIGKANYRSNARFCSQHYGLNAPSTLAKSLLSDGAMSSLNITSSNIKNWIKTNCRRIDIIIDADLGIFAGTVKSCSQLRTPVALSCCLGVEWFERFLAQIRP